MGLQEIERIVIKCLEKNLKLSGESVPKISSNTKPACELSGFDSLRALEVIVSLEEEMQCDLPPEIIFFNSRFDEVTVASIASSIEKIRKGKSK